MCGVWVYVYLCVCERKKGELMFECVCVYIYVCDVFEKGVQPTSFIHYFPCFYISNLINYSVNIKA